MSEPDEDCPQPSWAEVRALLEDALEERPEKRIAFVHERAGEESALALEVLALLDSETNAEAGFLEPPRVIPRAPRAPERVGPWELVRPLGHGGMGAVWLARRADGAFERLVAVKLLHTGLETPELIARFERERRVLAALDHPGIARLIDGGVTDEGRPWLAMEYIEGVPLDRWANERRLDVAARVDLIREIASAVDAAHRARFVHRDLKPANVLVDNSGRVKLLDFGIAKALDPIERAAHVVTRDVARHMTPAYASPEQLRGGAVTPASDVYALGVMLYEQLTGHLPIDVEGRSPAEVERLVSTRAPERPSRAALQPLEVAPSRRADGPSQLAAQNLAEVRGTTVAALRRTLRGDLDLVTLRALAKEPDRRYSSAVDLADDLARWREGRPVHARPDGVAYRARRFVGRHRAIVSLALLVVASLAGGLFFSLRYAREAMAARADQEALRVATEEDLLHLREATRQLFVDIHRTLTGVPGATRASDRLVRSVIALAERQDDPELQATLIEALVHHAENRLGARGQGAADAAGSVAAIDRALGIAQNLLERHGEKRGARMAAGNAFAGAALDAWARGDTLLAQERSLEASALFEELIEQIPEPRQRVGPLLASSHMLELRSRIELALGRSSTALELCDRRLELLESVRALGAFRLPGIYEGSAAAIQQFVARIRMKRGEYDLARAAFDRSTPHFDVSIRQHPPNDDVTRTRDERRMLEAGIAWGRGEVDAAAEIFEEVLESSRALVERVPDNLASNIDVVEAARALALAQVARGRTVEAAPLLAEALERLEFLASRGADPSLLFTYRANVHAAELELALTAEDVASARAALVAARACYAGHEDAFGDMNSHIPSLAWLDLLEGHIERLDGQPTRARAAYVRGLERVGSAHGDGSTTTELRSELESALHDSSVDEGE